MDRGARACLPARQEKDDHLQEGSSSDGNSKVFYTMTLYMKHIIHESRSA